MNCPFCHRLLYSRQQLKCGFCERELPAAFRLDAHAIDELKAENRAIDERRAAAKLKEEEERLNEKRRGDSAF